MKNLLTITLLIFPFFIQGQELYNLTMPASTLPNGVLGVRVLNQSYNESNLYRQMTAVRVMYGVTTKLTVICSGTVSDYHSKNLPYDFILHNHTGIGPPAYANTPDKGVAYPYIFDGLDVYAQYRFLSHDGQNTHFRMAAYGEASHVYIPSHLTEPDLMFHNSGIGTGVISTYLKAHFAATFTGGLIMPKEFNGNSYDKFGGIYPVTIKYGNAVVYNLALGYLLYPTHYKTYRQTNINVYLEFIGKNYGAATVTQQDGSELYHISSNIPILKAGNYIDMDPGVQFIIRSNLRIDCSMAIKLINQSYVHNYALYTLAIQRYFYSVHKHHEDNKS